jgi:hypothetical protein
MPPYRGRLQRYGFAVHHCVSTPRVCASRVISPVSAARCLVKSLLPWPLNHPPTLPLRHSLLTVAHLRRIFPRRQQSAEFVLDDDVYTAHGNPAGRY